MINKNIIALGFVSFFTDMASAMVTSILPIYIVYVLHQGVDKLGFIVAIATFVSYAFITTCSTMIAVSWYHRRHYGHILTSEGNSYRYLSFQT